MLYILQLLLVHGGIPNWDVSRTINKCADEIPGSVVQKRNYAERESRLGKNFLSHQSVRPSRL